MLVNLGVGPRGEGLVDLLMECHARIRRFCRLALTIGARLELPPAEVTSVATQCLRYFTEALPLHVRDEEDSLWPRLAGRSAALDATLAQMRAQHFGHEARVDKVVATLRVVLVAPDNVVARKRLAAAAATLESDFEEHLELEERELFPHLERELGAAEQVAVVAELRQRRLSG